MGCERRARNQNRQDTGPPFTAPHADILSRLRIAVYVPHFFSPHMVADVGWPGRQYSCISLFTCVILAHTRVSREGLGCEGFYLLLLDRVLGDRSTRKCHRPAERKIHYAEDVQPLLAQKCYSCHGEDILNNPACVWTTANALRHGDYGPVIKPRRRAGNQTDPPAVKWRRRGAEFRAVQEKMPAV